MAEPLTDKQLAEVRDLQGRMDHPCGPPALSVFLPEIVASLDELARLRARSMSDYGIDLDGARRSLDNSTMLWTITLGGSVTITVSARNHVQAIMLAAEENHLDGLPWDDELSVEVLQDKDAGDQTFFDEDKNTAVPLLEEWGNNTAPRVVSCSEY